MGSRNRAFLALLFAFCVFAAACGSGDDDATGDEATEVGEGETTDEGSSDDAEGTDSEDDESEAAPAGDVDRDATLVYATSFVTNSLDVPNVGTDFSFHYVNAIYDTLVRRLDSGELVPAVATEWEVAPEAITFTIAEGRTFHDDTPLDAEAVKANIDRIINCECRFAPLLESIESVEAVDNQVILNLATPAASLLEVLSDIPGMLASPASFGNDDLDVNPVGSGPYTVREYTDGGVKYDRWDGYYDAENTLHAAVEIRSIPDDNTRMSGLLSGEIDAAIARLGQLGEAEAGGLNIEIGVQAQIYQLALETDREPLANPDVRRAISHAIDREAINQGLYDGNCTPSVQPYPEGFPGHAAGGTVEEYGAFDLELARQLMADAGYADGFSITMGAPAITNYTNQLEIYQAQLAEIGITVEAIPDEGRTFVDRLVAGEYDSWLGPNTTARPSTIAYWTNYYAPGGARNAGGYELPGVDELLASAEAAPTLEDQAPILEEMVMTSLDEGARNIVVCLPQIVTVFNDNISGVAVSLVGGGGIRDYAKSSG
ncbi:MAG: ABC transporter substrate-binding protein [Acidimicrobiales bacterium]